MNNYSELKNIVEKGTYYYPAWKHYETPSSRVSCDRCSKNDLISCIGYENKDLCLNCCQAVTEILNRHSTIKTLPRLSGLSQLPETKRNQIKHTDIIQKQKQKQDRSMVLTNMEQKIFRDNSLRTYMKQNMFNPYNPSMNNDNDDDDDLFRTFMEQSMFQKFEREIEAEPLTKMRQSMFDINEQSSRTRMLQGMFGGRH
jgi:hypothetical protein